MDNFLYRYHIPKLTQDQVNNLNRPINCKEIEAVIKILPTKKNSGTDGFHAEFYQKGKEELLLLKVFPIMDIEGTLPDPVYEATVTLTPKPHKDSTKKENYMDTKIPNKILAN